MKIKFPGFSFFSRKDQFFFLKIVIKVTVCLLVLSGNYLPRFMSFLWPSYIFTLKDLC